MHAEQRVLAIRRLASTKDGRVVEANDIVLPAHQWELRYEWRAKQASTVTRRAWPRR